MKNQSKGFVRSTSHSLKFARVGKIQNLEIFLDAFKLATQQFLDHFWSHRIEWQTGKFFDVQSDQLEIPQMISTVEIPIRSELSARALKCSATQALGIVRAVTERRRKLLWLQSQGREVSKQLEKTKLTKPLLPSNFKAELNSICCSFEELSKAFNGFLQLHCLGKDFTKIRLPLKFHRRSNFWASKGERMASFLLSKNSVDIRWRIPPQQSKGNQIVGADQGIATLLTLSDGQTTQSSDDWTLVKIQQRLARRIKGSAGFRKAQEHRKNFIHQSINNLNWQSLKQINLENIVNIGFGKAKPRFLSHWVHSLIQEKIESKAKELGVQVNLQSSAFRSQRCSHCGFVFEGNRKGKAFKCKSCNFAIDADLNAAKNHEQSLISLPWSSELSKASKAEGFFWKPEVLLDCSGQEFAVPGSARVRR